MQCTNKIDIKMSDYRVGYLQVPCGHCLSCRINKQNDWSKRIQDECKMHKSNTFLTLTYEDDKRPFTVKDTGEKVWCIKPDDWTLFIKSLRQKIWRHSKKRVSFFTSAEYGTQSRQCHFHSIIFGMNANQHTQKWVKEVWHKGRTSTLPVMDGGADYCAKHQTKYDSAVDLEYQYPPYQTMSRKPAIGLNWILQHPDSISYQEHELAYLKFTKKGMHWLPAPRYYCDKVYTVEQKKEIRERQTKEALEKQADEMGINTTEAKIYNSIVAVQKENMISWNKYYGKDRLKRSKI